MREVASFLGVGALATALQYVVYAIGLALTPWPAAASSAAGYLSGSVLSYALNYHVTFRSDRDHAVAVPKFYAMVAVAFTINASIVALLVDWAGLNAWLGQVISTGVCLVFNYTVSRHWVFRGRAS
ncbi:MAG TPA: GtrA family protein [Ramlibacter sp.]|uniref:GtrA family protein n=1 Tax=Ramlibacter sp. TaxID=1917967 RepID=UPI002BE32472|nr:GtrA family protein [Ramlibacter sp.]HVZ44995.1 GtrA family protein [Ramlibacter sp.]